MTDETITLRVKDIEKAARIDVAEMRDYADHFRRAAALIDLIADALSQPLPTTDGSTGQDKAGEWYIRIPYTDADLLGFTVRHDAGA